MPRDSSSSYDQSLTSRDVQKSLKTGKRKIVATYDYRDEQGLLLFQTVRFDPKGFSYRRPNGQGEDIWDIKGVRRVLYRLPDILQAETVYVVEGEKDADRLSRLGLPATTSPMGAKHWQAEYAQYLKGKQVVILPDNDAEGDHYAQNVACSLQGVAAAVKIVRLPGLNEHGDVSDWLNAGGTKEELLEMVKQTPWGTDDGQPLPSSDQAERRIAGDDPWSHAISAPVFLAQEMPPFQGLAKDFLAPGAITMMAAPKGIGKTHIGVALAIALAMGGKFRGEDVQRRRVLLLDRDNPKVVVHERLKKWGALDAHDLSVLTRDRAPDLKNKAAWKTFPVDKHEVVIVDSVGSSTEGVREKDGRGTDEILATLLDLACRGPAILLLNNTDKAATTFKGREEWADRVDILFEIRDATGFLPTGKRAWWQELPEDSAKDFAARAERRKGRTTYRLAFIAAKFRPGVEPDPFCLEIRLPPDEPWTLHDVTAEMLNAGEEAKAKEERAKAERMEQAAHALAEVVRERAEQGTPLGAREEAETALKEHGLSRADARALIEKETGVRWQVDKRPGQRGRKDYLLPLHRQSAARVECPSSPHWTRTGEEVTLAARTGQGRRELESLKAAIGTSSRDPLFSPPEERQTLAQMTREERVQAVQEIVPGAMVVSDSGDDEEDIE